MMPAHSQSYLLLFILIISLAACHPARRHSTKGASRQKISPEQNNFNITRVLETQPRSSPFAKIAKTKPVDLPFAEQGSNSSAADMVRPRRSTVHLGVSVCDTLREWSQPDTATDFNGKTVEVMTMIDQDGTRQLQYFYETFCSSDDRPPCLGIDTSAYSSKCTTKYIWVNAYVRNELNQVGWAKIKIRGSCNCSLWSKNTEPTSIWDELLRKRR